MPMAMMPVMMMPMVISVIGAGFIHHWAIGGNIADTMIIGMLVAAGIGIAGCTDPKQCDARG